MAELSGQNRHRWDGCQVAAALCIATLMAGELVLLAWVFSSHRSRRMPVQATEEVKVAPPAVASNVAAVTTGTVATAQAERMSQPVLNPALKILQVRRRGSRWELQLRAQTGEREFAAREARVSVEWHRADGGAQLEWIAVPVGWENFDVKTLTARYDGEVPLRGCTVRTFYRQQLQDMRTIELSTP